MQFISRSTSRSTGRATRRLLAIVTCLGLAGAACASDGDDSTAPSTTAAAAAAAESDTTVAATDTSLAGTDSLLAPGDQPDIVGTALTSNVFTQLAGFVVDAGLIPTLRGGPFTVFAPTDAAFNKIPTPILRAVNASPELLTTVLTYHVVAGALTVADLQEGELETVAGIPLTITKDGDTTYVNGNAIAAADVAASNGVIHVMSDVLVPPLGDIPTVAQSLPGFETLVSLVVQAGLVETLSGEGPFTVFSPIDAAFEALPAATLAAVQADPALLTTVLTYHVVAGKLSTADLEEGKLTTVAGIDLTITKKDGVTYVDGNPIAVQNVQATNGVVHAMGAVLVPQS